MRSLNDYLRKLKDDPYIIFMIGFAAIIFINTDNYDNIS